MSDQPATPASDAPTTTAAKPSPNASRALPFAAVLFALGVAIFALSAFTAWMAPPWADTKTAYMMGGIAAGACTLCALLALLIRVNKTAGMIGIHAGLILPLVLAAGTGSRIGAGMDDAKGFYHVYDLPALTERTAEALGELSADIANYNAENATYLQDTDSNPKPTVPVSPKAYQVVGLGGNVVLSLFGFVALLALRPTQTKCMTD